jgi:hypothetical protein
MGTIDIEPGAQVPFDAAGWHITALLRDCCTLLGRFVGRDLERGDRTGQFFVDRRAVAKLRETALRRRGMRLAGTVACEVTHSSVGPVNEETAE